MKNAVLFLAFNRPDIAKRTFAEIAKVKPPRLYFACDGARENKDGEIKLVNQTRDIINLVNWQCEIKTLFQEKNLGCGPAVSTAITWFFENEEQGIILEDDCLPNQSFFAFCEDLLEKYKSEEKVASISGFNYQKTKRGEASYYFADLFECVGWATWKYAWQNYFKLDVNELDENEMLSIIENKPWSKGMKKYWVDIWNNMKEHKVSSWAWPFAFCCLQKNARSVISNVNLISNIGFGLGATNISDSSNPLANTPTFEIQFPLKHPEKIESDFKADEYTYKLATKRSLIKRIKGKLRKWFNLITKGESV